MFFFYNFKIHVLISIKITFQHAFKKLLPAKELFVAISEAGHFLSSTVERLTILGFSQPSGTVLDICEILE